MKPTAPMAVLGLLVSAFAAHAAAPARADAPLRVVKRVSPTEFEISDGRRQHRVARGERIGQWTLVEVLTSGDAPRIVFEDFTRQDGAMRIVDTQGVSLDLGKTAESSATEGGLYLGYSSDEVRASAADVLGNRILSNPADPDYETIARVFPPIRKIRSGTFAFVGTPDTTDKVGFSYGGRTANFDPAVYVLSIRSIREANTVSHGLVGDYLPVLRFVYPEPNDAWTELLAFAPFRVMNDNTRVQPVWYRVSRIERGVLQWTRYFDTYHSFPLQATADPQQFYADLIELKRRWDATLQPAMRIELPDARVQNMVRASLVRAMFTRVGDAPRYGAVDKDYGASEHDGFPDTFNVDTTAMIEWGLLERAGRYIDNYFREYVRDDGTLLYRGPETGQFGRMLTVLAQFVQAGGDPSILLAHRKKIDAITNMLRDLRAQARELPVTDASYGLIRGWSEADSSLDPAPARYLQPYLSNSTEAARGLRDLGHVWQTLGRNATSTELAERGRQLVRDSAELQQDLQRAISRSMLTVDGTSVIPAIAGVQDPFDVAVRKDPLDPQHRSYRAYMEMLYSGTLTRDQVRSIVDYRTQHSHDFLLGTPTAYGYNTREVAGFLSYGHGYGLIQHDLIREALLLLYSDMAHQYTRGQWLAPETRRPLIDEDAAPYCVPAQLVVPLLVRWLLVFEDPNTETLWLAKGTPRAWLRDGALTRVTNVRTRWGAVSYSLESQLQARRVRVRIEFPSEGIAATTQLRLRAPEGARLKSVSVNGQRWTAFDAALETITLPPGLGGSTTVVANYR